MCGATPVASAIVEAATDRRAADGGPGRWRDADGVRRSAPSPAVIDDFERVTGWR